MLTPELYAALKAKPEAELKPEDKTAMKEYEDAQAAAGRKAENTEHMVPLTRLNEVLEQNKKLAKAVEDQERKTREADEKRLKEQNDYKTLYEQSQQELEALKPKVQFAEQAETTLKNVLAARIKDLPESARKLVPVKMSVQDQLDWLAENGALLMKPAGKDIGAGAQGGGSPEGNGAANLTPDEQVMAKDWNVPAEDYAKHK